MYEKVDMRTQTFNVPPQEVSLRDEANPKFFLFQILTKDSVTVFVTAIMYYKVKDATSAIANVDDYSTSAQLLAATTLRNVLGIRWVEGREMAEASMSGTLGTSSRTGRKLPWKFRQIATNTTI